MQESFGNRLRHAWNAFQGKESQQYTYNIGPGSSVNPDRALLSLTSEKAITGAIFNQIAIDVSSVAIQHVRLDKDKRYAETMDSGLNNCLTVEANIDQSAVNFIQDVVISMLDEGSVGVAPIDTTGDIDLSSSYDIFTMRTGKVIDWYPAHVRLDLYNDKKGVRQELVFEKRQVAVIENPLYTVMNEPNSILKRLVAKLNLLDAVDTQSANGKLDLIFQVPYVVKTPLMQERAEARRKAIDEQLAGSKYGIAWVDGTEKITQLNRSVENNLMAQIEYLTRMLYGQLGISQAIFDGTADEKTMINYFNRTIIPVLDAIVGGYRRSFLTKTARSQGQSIMYTRNPFKYITIKDFSSFVDTVSRNAIFTANEIRSEVGYRPNKDPEADALRNKNLNPPTPQPSNGSKPDEAENNVE